MRGLMLALALLLAVPAAAQSTTLARSARDAALRRAEPAGPVRPSRIDLEDTVAARSDYLLHCSGCHGSDGAGNRRGRIPPLAGRIGNFLALPAGRAFIVQVPGVNASGLDDASIARLMNWMIPQLGGASVPAGFRPFDPDEVGRARASRPVDVAAYRRTLARELADLGRAIDY